jgi:hypothetical protein
MAAIHISDQPSVVASPAFAGLGIRVPLSESPSEAWLELLSTKGLPGKGHRLVADGIEFYLDRGSHDVLGTMKRLAEAIEATSAEFDAARAELARLASRAAEGRRAAQEKIDRQLSDWWSQNRPPEAASSDVAPAEGTAMPAVTEGAPDTKQADPPQEAAQ